MLNREFCNSGGRLLKRAGRLDLVAMSPAVAYERRGRLRQLLCALVLLSLALPVFAQSERARQPVVESPINVIPNEINPLGEDSWAVRTRPGLAGARLVERFPGAQVQSIPSLADTLVLLIEGSSDNPLAIEAELAANPDINWFEQ